MHKQTVKRAIDAEEPCGDGTPDHDMGAQAQINSPHIIGEILMPVVLAALVRVPWMFMTPMREAPDEHCHLWVARFLFEHHRLPHVKDILDAGIIAVYGSLPQLGYIPHVIAAHLLPLASVPMAFRLASVVLGVITVAITYAVARELFPTEKWLRVLLPSLVATHPQLVFVNGYTNTDSTVAMLGAAITLISIRMMKYGLSYSAAAILGLVLGILALTKYSAYSLFFCAAFAFVASCFLHRTTIAKILQCAGLLIGTLAATCGWWFVRQRHEYPDDILGTKTMYHSWAVRFNKPLEFKVGLWQIISMPAYWQMKFYSFWGLFGPLKRYLWQPMYYAYAAIMGVAAAGGVKWAYKIATTNRAAKQDGQTNVATDACPSRLPTAVVLMSAIGLIVNLGSMVWAASVNLGLAQGRYLFGVDVPIFLLIIYGAGSWGRVVQRWVLIAFLATNLLALSYQFVVLYPLYGGFHLM